MSRICMTGILLLYSAVSSTELEAQSALGNKPVTTTGQTKSDVAILQPAPKDQIANAANLATANSPDNDISAAYLSLKNQYGLKPDSSFLYVDGKAQKIYLLVAKESEYLIQKEYLVSTGKYGFGNAPNSGRTPSGVLRIAGSVKLKDYLPDLQEIREDKQLLGITPRMKSRIFNLEGLESSNDSAIARGIAIHGTNLEELIGKPVSHGCVRMKNADVIELYELVRVGTLVYISSGTAPSINGTQAKKEVSAPK